jgi:hypothetical protein
LSKIALSGNPSGTGTFTIASPNSNTDRTLNLPDAAGTIALTSQIPAIASTAEAEAGTNNTNFITPLRMREGFNATGSAPVYACRAWVNFNGVSGASIRASGNVSSVARNGTGDYTVNFATAMPDANYSPIASAQPNTADGISPSNGQVTLSIVGTTGSGALPSTAGYRIYVGYAGGNPRDVSGMYTAVFR